MNSKEEMQIPILLQKLDRLAEIENELNELLALTILQGKLQQHLKELQAFDEKRFGSAEQQRLIYEIGGLKAKIEQKHRDIIEIKKTSKERNEQCSKVEQLIKQEEIAKSQHVGRRELEEKLNSLTNNHT